MLRGSHFTYKDDLFTSTQQQALREYNGLLSSLNTYTESKSLQEIRLAALELFVASHSNGDGAIIALDSAFRVRD